MLRSADPRRIAILVLEQVERSQARISQALDNALSAIAGLPQGDRALATELVYGVERHRNRLDRALAAYARGGPRGLARVHPTALRAMRLAAYQILLLDRIPAAAAVDAAVEVVRREREPHTAGFVNAVLRRLAREGEPPLPDPAKDPLAYLVEAASLPRWLAKAMLRWLPPAEAVALGGALLRRPPTTLRANSLLTSAESLSVALTQLTPPLPTTSCVHSPEGLVMTASGDPRRLAAPLYAAGHFTVQDEAAQLVSHLVGPRPGEAILDACAGRGGKFLHMAALCPEASIVVPVDRHRAALCQLRSRARRLGLKRAEPLLFDLAAPLPLRKDLRFDVVLLDAPCSGLGVLRRHPEAKWRLRPEDLLDLASRQAALLDSLVPRVRPGGRLVYAVCTFSPAEGADQIKALVHRHPELHLDPPPTGPVDWTPLLNSDGLTVTLRPDRHGTDGFFLARLVKRQ